MFFCADPDPEEKTHPVRLLLLLGGSSLAAGLLMLQLGETVAGHPGLPARIETVLRGFVGLPGPVALGGQQPALVSTVLLAFGAATLLLPLLSALRTSRGHAASTPENS